MYIYIYIYISTVMRKNEYKNNSEKRQRMEKDIIDKNTKNDLREINIMPRTTTITDIATLENILADIEQETVENMHEPLVNENIESHDMYPSNNIKNYNDSDSLENTDYPDSDSDDTTSTISTNDNYNSTISSRYNYIEGQFILEEDDEIYGSSNNFRYMYSRPK